MSKSELDKCRFCQNPEDISQPFLEGFGLHPLINSANLMETEHFDVKPDILPVHPLGRHVLVIPKLLRDEHCYSYADLPQQIGCPSEVYAIVKRIEEKWGSPVSVFEHGSVKAGNNNQSIYHAHAHVIETGRLNIISYMQDLLRGKDIEYEIHPNLESKSYVHNIRRIGLMGNNYLTVQNHLSILVAYDKNPDGTPANTMPSQITQKGMSSLFTGCEVNWKAMFDESDPEKFSMEKLSAQRLYTLVNDLPDGHF